MQINELIKLTDWFQAKVVAKGIPANFQALFNKMNANTSDSKKEHWFTIQQRELIENIKTEKNLS